MPTPSNRTPLRVARGTYSNLNSSVSDIQEGEICYATDQNKLYVKKVLLLNRRKQVFLLTQLLPALSKPLLLVSVEKLLSLLLVLPLLLIWMHPTTS